MKRIKIIFPNKTETIFTFEELGFDETTTKEEISDFVNEHILENISWGCEIIDEELKKVEQESEVNQ